MECAKSQESCNLVDEIMTTNNNSIHLQLPKFTGKNFDNWCIQMHVLFRSQYLGDLVNIGYNEVIQKNLRHYQRSRKILERNIKKHFMQLPSSG